MAQEDRPDPKLVDWSKKGPYRARFRKRSSIAFLYMCMGTGFLALITPLVLPLIGGYEGRYSISYFYHVPETRDLFVACLAATASFLIFFEGFSRRENLLLSAAGVLLLLVAFVPTTEDQCADTMFSWHAAFAVGFFFCLFVVAVFFAKSRLEFIIWPPLRARLSRTYNLAGILMIALPLLAYAIHLLVGRDCSHVIYWIEASAIWAFALYWFAKTYEYKLLLGYKFPMSRR